MPLENGLAKIIESSGGETQLLSSIKIKNKKADLKASIKTVMIIKVLVMFFFLGSPALASKLKYNGGKKPFTLIKTNGDYIVGGLSKTLIYTKGSFRSLDVMGPISGGLTEGGKIDGVICTEHNIYLFDLEARTGFEKNEQYFDHLLCASNGRKFLIFDGHDIKIIDDNAPLADAASLQQLLLTAPKIRFKNKIPMNPIDESLKEVVSILPWKKDFLLVTKSGRLLSANSSGIVAIRGGLGNLLDTSEIAGMENHIYLVDENGFYRFTIENEELRDKVRIPVNPCSDGERCGISVAQDGSYVVAGYWGIWQGEFQSIKPIRISEIPNLSREGGRTSISHSGLSGKYLYLADDDIDLGKLPPLPSMPLTKLKTNQQLSDTDFDTELETEVGKDGGTDGGTETQKKCSSTSSIESKNVWSGRKSNILCQSLDIGSRKVDYLPLSREKRRIVWLKNKVANSFFTWKTPRGLNASVIYLQPHEPLPQDWVAAEEEELIATPLEQPNIQPTIVDLEGNFWWRSRLELDKTLLDLKGLPHRKVKVGVIDSGLAFEHPSFAGQLARNMAEIPLNGIDDDGNGLIDDSEGWDFVHDDPMPEDEHGHGTHVAGLIAGKFIGNKPSLPSYELNVGQSYITSDSTNEIENTPMGVASDHVDLIIAKGLGVRGTSNSLDLARAVVYAVDRGAEVINCSWGGGFSTQVIKDALSYAISKGVIVMMSAGNTGSNNDKVAEFPKKLPGLTVVASSDHNDKKPKHSNYGKSSVTWASPGDKILSTTKDGYYGVMSGTSMANAISTGVTALALSYSGDHGGPITTPQKFSLAKEVLSSLCESADKPGWQDKTQCGHLNIRKYFQLRVYERSH